MFSVLCLEGVTILVSAELYFHQPGRHRDHSVGAAQRSTRRMQHFIISIKSLVIWLIYVVTVFIGY